MKIEDEIELLASFKQMVISSDIINQELHATTLQVIEAYERRIESGKIIPVLRKAAKDVYKTLAILEIDLEPETRKPCPFCGEVVIEGDPITENHHQSCIYLKIHNQMNHYMEIKDNL